MKIRIILFTFLAFLWSEESLAAKPINNMIDVAIPAHVDGVKFSLDEIKDAIIAGCAVKGWTPVLTGQDRIEASIQVRSHSAKVEITFHQTAYSIVYLDSVNLDYNEKRQKIHRNYNKWIILLSRAIQNELTTRI